MSTTLERTLRDFDHPDHLNEDGTVTLRMQPSNWRAYNISPDTYQTVNGDSWVENELDYLNSDDFDSRRSILGRALGDLVDRHPIRLDYDHFRWDYDHAGIVRDFAETLCNWIVGELFDLVGTGQQHELIWDPERGTHYWSEDFGALAGEVLDSWSPTFYNFQSDGFEMALTIHPQTLRDLTPDFDLDQWVHEHYRSVDGFASFVPSRVRDDDDWAADYDGQFRVEYLFAKVIDPFHEREWITALAEDEYEVYMNRTTVEPDEDRIRETILAEHGYMESGYTLSELEDWARELAPTQEEVLIP